MSEPNASDRKALVEEFLLSVLAGLSAEFWGALVEALPADNFEDLDLAVTRRLEREHPESSVQVGDLVPLAAVEAEHVRRVLALCGDRRNEAARVLQVAERTLFRRLSEIGVPTARGEPRPPLEKRSRGRPRREVAVGERFGPFEVLGLEVDSVAWADRTFRVRCTLCGAEWSRKGDSLANAESLRTKRCLACRSKSSAARAEPLQRADDPESRAFWARIDEAARSMEELAARVSAHPLPGPHRDAAVLLPRRDELDSEAVARALAIPSLLPKAEP